MGLMKEIFIADREREEYENETLELYYKHLLLLTEEEECQTQEIINEIKN
jgi:hypothetical protein